MRKIQAIESTPATRLPLHLQQLQEKFSKHFQEADEVLTAEFRGQAHAIASRFEEADLPLVIVNGDTWTTNILISRDPGHPDTRITDWERGGAGYAGQDAGRLLWDFFWKDRPDLATALISEYINNGDPALREQRILQLQFGIVLEASRWLSNNVGKIKRGYKPEQHDDLRRDIPKIQQKALELLELIEQEAAIKSAQT